ncbi:MAG TPA: histone deacetylase [Acidobacteriota bacterium]|nr:histone deacetylase [Acidobacteriota bacterium]
MKPIGLSILLHEQEHAPPAGHPENCDRLRPVVEALWGQTDFVIPESVPAGLEPVLRVHSRQLIDSLLALEEQGGGMVGLETYVTGTSVQAALAVVGAVLHAVDRAFGDGPAVSFILGRPPGHHTETRRAMGFCLINNVAVAARYALDNHPAQRVAIVDFDVHHGNGTQEIFYERDDVLYVSTHQYPFYPGTGAVTERGNGAGKGYTLNFPLPAGTGDEVVVELFNGEIASALREFRPHLLLISAGFDGHALDPLGGLQLTGKAYYSIASTLADIALELCDGRLVAVLEGGYDARGNLDSIGGFLRGLEEA